MSEIKYGQRVSIYLGNIFEHYDTALISLLAPFIAPLFFPDRQRITALIMTYGLIPLGMVIRPMGALFFGFLGDKKGRDSALFLSMTGMAAATTLIALLPTYKTVGLLAPIFLALLRIAQNFFASGEQQGGAIFLLERSPPEKADMVSSIFSASTIVGILSASLLVTLFCHLRIVETYWRLLFTLGSLTAIFGLFLRKGLRAPAIQKKENGQMLSHLQSLTRMPKEAAMLFFAGGFSYATYSVALVMINGFVPLISSVTNETMLLLNTPLLFFDMLTLPLFGKLARKTSGEKLMIASSGLSCLLSLPLFYFMEKASLAYIIIARIILVTLGVAFSATLHSWAQKLVPQDRRYSFISFYIALGSQIIGGPTSSISLLIYKQTSSTLFVGCYWSLLALITCMLLTGVKAFVVVREIEKKISLA